MAASANAGSTAQSSVPVRVSAATLAFGQVAVGNSGAQTLKVISTARRGARPTLVTVSVSSAPVEFAITSGGGSFVLKAGATHAVSVAFAPTAAGAAAGRLTIKTGSGSTRVSLSGTGLPTIKSASTSAPTPLTALRLATAGFDSKQQVTATYSNSSSYSFTDSEAVASDGSVVLPTPLYTDPTTNRIGAGTVSLVLSQGSAQTAPVTLNIQDLPAISTYGTTPGQISHAFLVFNALLLGRQLTQLQAAHSLSGVDTSQEQSAVSTLLKNTLLARNDVDRVLLDQSTRVTDGSFPDGTPLEFNAVSLDSMDRVLAVYLMQEFGNVPIPAAALRTGPSAGASVTRLLGSARSTSLSAAGPTALPALLDALDNFKTTADFVSAMQIGKTPFDYALIAMKGAADVLSSVGVPAKLAPTPGVLNALGIYGALGTGWAIVTMAAETGVVAGDYLAWMVDANFGGPKSTLQLAANQAKINADQARLFADAVSNLTFGFLKGVQLGAPGSTSVLGLYGVGEGDSLALLSGLYGKFAGWLKAEPSAGVGFQRLVGQMNIQNGQGIAAAQTLVGFTCAGMKDEILGIADPAGGYDLLVPLGAPGVDYSNCTLTATDIFTGNELTSEALNLSGNTTTQVGQLPTLTGTCSDTNDLDPDGDDPDCD